jgi:hypothetical protein
LRQDRDTGARTDQGEREVELQPTDLPKLKLPRLCVGLRDGEVSQVAVGTEVAEGKRLPPSLIQKGSGVDQAIGILGQAILVLVGLACVVLLVFLILLTVRGIRRLVRELRTPIMPETDFYIPPSFDRSGR